MKLTYLRLRTVTADVRRVKGKRLELIGTVHEPEISSADKHVKIDRTISGKDAFQCVRKICFPPQNGI
jgi:hypothetical protein